VQTITGAIAAVLATAVHRRELSGPEIVFTGAAEHREV